MSSLYPFEVSDLIDVYHAFIDNICITYNVRNQVTPRVFQEVLQAHVTAILTERTYSLFNTLAEDWRYRLIEMLFPTGFPNNHYNYGVDRHLSEREIVNQIAYNNLEFNRINIDIENILKPARDKHDPMYTIWDVQLDRNILHVSALGDHRIEQWHTDYGVSSTLGETITVDLYNYRQYVSKVLDLRNRPAFIDGVPKDEILDTIIRNSIAYLLTGKRTDYDAIYNNIQHIVTSPEAIITNIENYFNLELKEGIDRLTQNCSITSFTIYGTSMTLSFNNTVSHQRQRLSRRELELIQAENNGDYIPARHRY